MQWIGLSSDPATASLHLWQLQLEHTPSQTGIHLPTRLSTVKRQAAHRGPCLGDPDIQKAAIKGLSRTHIASLRRLHIGQLGNHVEARNDDTDTKDVEGGDGEGLDVIDEDIVDEDVDEDMEGPAPGAIAAISP